MGPGTTAGVRSNLSITVSGGTGVGPTPLAAFDAALGALGVQNFNLVRLSSVIPPGARVSAGPVASAVDGDADAADQVDLRAEGWSSPLGGWGDRLYAVWAHAGAHQLGEEAWAGVAWVQEPGDGRGLFVEHEGSSEQQVRDELAATLASIAEARGMGHLEPHSVVVGARCEGRPAAALVLAPFATEPWDVPPRPGA